MSSTKRTNNGLISAMLRTLSILTIMILFNFLFWQSNKYLTKKAVISSGNQTTNFLNNLIEKDIQRIYSNSSNLDRIDNFTLKVDENSLDIIQINKLSNLIEESINEDYKSFIIIKV